jgi:hypothetical protein
VPPPSPGMLINHITGNRKSLYQLMQACCKPDTGENHTTILRTSSDRARPSPSKWALRLCSAEKRHRLRKRRKFMHARERRHGAPRAAGRTSRSPAGLSTAIKRRLPRPKRARSHVNHRRPAGDTSWRTCLHPMMERHMLTSESSYFDFLMKNRGVRRTPVPFAQAVGVLPELARAVRLRRLALQPKAAA